MKKINILLFFILSGFSLWAQNKFTKVADNLFERFEYVKAAKEYSLLVEKGKSDGYVYKQLGECYYNMFNTVESAKWYAMAIKTEQDAETYFNYAQMLKANIKYEEANTQMKVFAAKAPTDQRAIAFNKNPDYLPSLIEKDKLFEVKFLDINSEKSDFGAALYGDALYFSSARKDSGKKYGWNEEVFLDIYQSNLKADGSFSEPTPVSELNTTYHEGPVSITSDGNTIYFSSESFNSKLYEKNNAKRLKFGQVHLFKATKKNEKWDAITAMPFNDKKYSTSNPSIDKEGKTLYFSSNMPGSIGGTDIWKVQVNNDGTYGTPENLGDKINTPGDENFPFITDDNVLYFASNGLTGFGGLDVFIVDLKKNDFPINAGKPVNTEKDDFALTYNTTRKLGYLSSNRSGEDHIYSSIPICKGKIKVVVKNLNDDSLLPNSKVLILDENNNVIGTQVTNENGEVIYDVDCEKIYIIEAYKDGYVTAKTSLEKLTGGTIVVNISIKPIDVIITETEIILNPIYFDFDKSNITKQGAEELDKLVYVMSQNDTLKIYVKSHTDSRGDDKYNLNLSDKRAKSTVQYVISKGIDASRISGKGFGETELKIDCKNNCTEEQNAINRRSEFLLVK
ncbi:OmpA family protein [Flavobacterium pectinovorum]|uniref:OmpA family protein n=1 Tax=Flavobacterium pectinovorum TaxID=29533 RepID=UPI001FAD97DA|nr:OmpA family protein [Flavobacterium pectinovorum]MCI9845111.1 OmpA family protein [Flavobacterium pectinovorum]